MRASIAVLILTLAGCGQSPPEQPAPENNPCTDARYVELAERDVDDMTEREYAYFLQRDEACTTYQREAPTREAVQASARSMDTIWGVMIMGSLISGIVWLATAY